MRAGLLILALIVMLAAVLMQARSCDWRPPAQPQCLECLECRPQQPKGDGSKVPWWIINPLHPYSPLNRAFPLNPFNPYD